MKKMIYSALFIIALLMLAGCAVTSETTAEQTNTQIIGGATNVHEATLEIEGMTCTSCALGAEYQLKQVDGVLDAKIIYEEGKGYVTYDADKVNAETIARASDIYPANVVFDEQVIQ